MTTRGTVQEYFALSWREALRRVEGVLHRHDRMMKDLIRLSGAHLSARTSRKLAKALPWIGAAIAVLTVVETMKRKGVVRGGVDTALDALPFVGAMKNVAETVRGRDFIADRASRAAATARPR
jgi:hypothetical protein